MKRKIVKLVQSDFGKKILIPLILLILWIFLTLLYIFNYNLSLSVISYPGSKNNFSNFTTGRLYAGDVVRGKFNAQENNLGIVTVNFTTFNQVAYANQDILVFRIKQSGAKNWYYQNIYRSGTIFQVPFFPFGFPKIADSKGKSYVFEIKSLNGNQLNAVALNSWEPVLVTRYQVPKTKLLSSNKTLFTFLERKIRVAFESPDVQFYSLVYLLPFIFYVVLFLSPFRKIILPRMIYIKDQLVSLLEKSPILRPLVSFARAVKKSLARNFDFIIFAVILINIFFIPVLNDIALIVVLILWLYVSRYYKNTSRESFIVGIILLVLCPFILLFNLENIAEKSAVWAYMFFLAGTVQILIEEYGGQGVKN